MRQYFKQLFADAKLLGGSRFKGKSIHAIVNQNGANRGDLRNNFADACSLTWMCNNGYFGKTA